MNTLRYTAISLPSLLSACVGAPPSHNIPDPRVQRGVIEITAGPAYLPLDATSDDSPSIKPQVQGSLHLLRRPATRLSILTNNLGAGIAFQWQPVGADTPDSVALSIAPAVLAGELLYRDGEVNVAPGGGGDDEQALPALTTTLPASLAAPLTSDLDLIFMLRPNMLLELSGAMSASLSAGLGIIAAINDRASLRASLLYSHFVWAPRSSDEADDFTHVYPAAQLLIGISFR